MTKELLNNENENTNNKIDYKTYLINWKLNNKDKVKSYNKKYYENSEKKSLDYYHKNKDLISELKKEKIICDCGSSYNKHTKSRHEKIAKHIKYIEKNNLVLI